MAAPKPKFMMLGKSKFVHVVRTKAWDLKHSECQMVRKMQVAGNVPKGNGLSPEAAHELDPCSHCEPGALIHDMLPSTKERRKQETQDLLEQMREARKPKTSHGLNTKGFGSFLDGNKKAPKSKKARKSEAGDKAPKVKPKPRATKTGPLSVGGDAEKAGLLKEFAEEHGWKVKVSEDKPGLKLVAKRGKETITCWFDGGKYDLVRIGYIEVEGASWRGNLRAAHACRRQMANEGRDRPHPNPGAGRSAPRGKREEEPTPETESPEDAFKRVPFLVDDDDLTIIDAIKGKSIRWRNGVSGVVEEAQLPAEVKGKKRDKIVLKTHPTKNRRILEFLAVDGFDSATGREVYGQERAVAIDKIIRVL